MVVVVVTSRRGGEEEEKEIQPDRAEAKKMTAISFCDMGSVTSTFELAMLSGAREAIFLSPSQSLSPGTKISTISPKKKPSGSLPFSAPFSPLDAVALGWREHSLSRHIAPPVRVALSITTKMAHYVHNEPYEQ